jgi:hypothetical protein
VAVATEPVITLAVRNHSVVVQRQDLEHAFGVFLKQANYDLHKYWNHWDSEWKSWKTAYDPYVPFVERICALGDGQPWPDSPAVWRASIYDDPSQAASDPALTDFPSEALRTVGYHFVQDDVPHMIVFAALAQQAGSPWTLTFSHELLECLVDPGADRDVAFGKETYELEVCDPVQFQAYPISGTWVSNFITPAWFDHPPKKLTSTPARPYDFAKQLVSPRQRALGGSRTLKIHGREKTEVLTPFGSVVAPPS